MELIDRIKKPTPKFHKKAINWCVVLMAVAGGLIGLHETEMVTLPEGVVTMLYVGEVVLGAVAGTAKTAVDDGGSEQG